jgi:hypothetical protein
LPTRPRFFKFGKKKARITEPSQALLFEDFNKVFCFAGYERDRDSFDRFAVDFYFGLFRAAVVNRYPVFRSSETARYGKLSDGQRNARVDDKSEIEVDGEPIEGNTIPFVPGKKNYRVEVFK